MGNPPSPRPTSTPTPTGGPVLNAQAFIPTGGAAVVADPNDPLLKWSNRPTFETNQPDPSGGFYGERRREGKAVAQHIYGDEQSQITASKAVADFWNWDESKRAAFGKRLYSIGIIDDPANFNAMYSAWSRAVRGAAESLAAGQPRTPWEVVDLWDGMSDNKRDKKPTTQTSYNVPSASEAEAAIRQIFRDKVGRDPDDAEMSQYRGMIVRKAKENPSVSTTSYDAAGNATTQTSGGVDLQGELGKMIEEDDDYGAYQAAVPLFNALMNAIGAPV